MTATSTIPASPEEVTAQWLTAALRAAGAQADVEGIRVDAVGTGQTGATYRITATYAHHRHELPDTFIVKLPSQDQDVRQRVAPGYRSEYVFYTDFARTVHVPTPRCFHIEIANEGVDFVALLADLAPAAQGDQLAGCSAAEAAVAVRALAGLHGPRWCDPALLGSSGIIMPRPDAVLAQSMGEFTNMAVDITVQRLGDRITAQDRATLTESAALVPDWLMLHPHRFSLLHGDFRLDNLLFDPDGSGVTVVDWQTLAVGLPARDLAYFAGTSLLPDDRAGVERELVETYHDALLVHGVTGYGPGSCWEDYCLGMLQIPVISTLGFAFAAVTDRGDDMVLTMLARGCRAIRELRTLERIRQ